MELAPVGKLDNKNMAMLKKIDDDVLSRKCDVNVIFWISGN